MENRYYIFWCNYDGSFVEEFDNEMDLEKRYTVLKNFHDEEEYGTFIKSVVFGSSVEFEKIETAIKYKIKEK